MSSQSNHRIISEYYERREQYLQLERIVCEKMHSIIDTNGFFVMDMAHRVKEVESLKDKVVRKNGKYQSLDDITDLFGIRIICYFQDTVDEIAKAIEEAFVIDKANSIDKMAQMQATQFGYLSLHYVCSLKKTMEYADALSDIRFEVQIRTVLQHAWAEIEHDLGYKSEFGVPRAIRREFSRVAGLLEIADGQFVDLRRKTKQYVVDIKERIVVGDVDDLPIDQVTLNEYVVNNLRFVNVVNAVKKDLGVEVAQANLTRYLELLDYLGVTTLGELALTFRHNQKLIISMIRSRVNKLKLDIVSMSMIFRYLCISELVVSKYSNEMISRFSHMMHKGAREAAKMTDEVIEIRDDFWASHRGLDV